MPRGKRKPKDKAQQDVPVGERVAGEEVIEQAEAERSAAKSDTIATAASEISGIEVEIAEKRALINKKKERLKKEFNVGKRAFAAAYALYKMEDETARTSIIADTLECMRALDLLDPTAPLFSKAGVALPKASPPNGNGKHAEPEELPSAQQEGRGAFDLGIPFNKNPYSGMSESSRINKDFWERGWLARQTENEAATGGDAAETPPPGQAGAEQPRAH